MWTNLCYLVRRHGNKIETQAGPWWPTPLTTALWSQRQASHIYRKAPGSQPTEKPCLKNKLTKTKNKNKKPWHKAIYGNFLFGKKRPLPRLDLWDLCERAGCELYSANTHCTPVKKDSVLRGYYRNESTLALPGRGSPHGTLCAAKPVPGPQETPCLLNRWT